MITAAGTVRLAAGERAPLDAQRRPGPGPRVMNYEAVLAGLPTR